MNESEYAWEREALAYLSAHLPDHDPWRAWANFEFIDDAGKVNEVDVLVLSPRGLFLIEIKSRPGDVSGDAHTWTWVTEGRPFFRDNPQILANRKAKRLAGLLRQQPSIIKGKYRVPFIQEVVFLSAQQVRLRLPEMLCRHVYLRGRPGDPKDTGIIAALHGTDQVGTPIVDRTLGRAVGRAVEEAGIRPSQRHKRVGDYELGKLIAEGETWQDFDGKHVSANVHRRIRVYTFAKATSEPARAALMTLASREFRLLQDIDHPGVLRVLDFKESERGPALIYDHDPNAARLDFILKEHGQRLTADLRLSFIRQLAETLRYAHEKRLYHRCLSPQSILVRDLSRPRPRLQVMNWSTAVREGSSSGSAVKTSGTLHPEEYVEDPAKVYLAPEAWQGGADAGPHHDVFSLGAIVYHVFAGVPPASSPLELQEKLRSGNGLQLSDALDGASRTLQDLVRLSTHPDVTLRIASMDEFLARLAEVEKEIALPSAEPTIDPADAKADDRIEGGFTVIQRLGRGASADALLVTRNGGDDRLVLKVAIDGQHNDRLKGEAEVLAKLHHQNIVTLKEALTVAGRTALLLERAGEETLAQRLRKERPSLDLIRRFGEELLSAVDYLEQEGIAHRDIKPDNIGIARTGQTGQLRLVLFDFSLARTPVDSIRAGTPPYVDPFLPLRRPPRWDVAAERYATVVTLYEMLTGTVPVWGDGRSDPALLDCEATLDPERFDPHLRDGFLAFFAKAFRREPKDRFDNAEEMLRAWRQVFDSARPPAIEGEDWAAIARSATAATPVADLGYGVEALNVLDRMGIHSVRQLLAVDRIKFRYLSNVGDRIRKEIRLKAKDLARLRPDLAPGQPSIVEGGGGDEGAPPSIDRLAELLLPRRPAGEDLAEDRALAAYLGLEGERTAAWTSVGEAAGRCDMGREAMTAVLLKARERWSKQPAITGVRSDLAVFLNAGGGVMTATEASSQLLAARGSVLNDEGERLRFAGSVVRAATEVEGALEHPRYHGFAEHVPMIAVSDDAILYALELAEVADAQVDLDPLPSPQKALERLQDIERPAGLPECSPQRLPKLATAVASRARLSSRGELYPAGLAAERAVRLAIGALVGADELTIDELARRIRGRFPEAAPLPGRPDLDALLTQAGAELKWDDGRQLYRRPTLVGGLSATPGVARLKTEGPAVELTEDVVSARAFEEKLAYALRTGGFLALTCEPKRAREAEAELLRRFAGLERFSFDRLLLDAMTAEAKAKNIDWSVVLTADASGRGSRDWPNLLRLVGLAAPKAEERLRTATRPVLLVHPGLIARYDLMPMLERLRDQAGRPDGVPALWALIPMTIPGLPLIDGTAVPVIGGAQWSTIPDAWLQNAHRAGTRAA